MQGSFASNKTKNGYLCYRKSDVIQKDVCSKAIMFLFFDYEIQSPLLFIEYIFDICYLTDTRKPYIILL